MNLRKEIRKVLREEKDIKKTLREQSQYDDLHNVLKKITSKKRQTMVILKYGYTLVEIRHYLTT